MTVLSRRVGLLNAQHAAKLVVAQMEEEQRNFTAARSQEKVQLEHTLEQEQECLVNKLMRKIEKLETETNSKQTHRYEQTDILLH